MRRATSSRSTTSSTSGTPRAPTPNSAARAPDPLSRDHDAVPRNRIMISSPCLSMIFSENRFPLFRIMLLARCSFQQSPIEANHVGIALAGQPLIGDVKALEILRRRPDRREAEDAVGDAGVVARIGGGDHQAGRHHRIVEDLANGP